LKASQLLVALTEIRDNAIHFINAGPDLAKQVLEIGTATVIGNVLKIKGTHAFVSARALKRAGGVST
jgi:hypothetical protein